MRNTPNYNLPQYDGTDKFTKEVLNDAFTKVDTAISDLQETFNINGSTSTLTTQEVVNARNGKQNLKERIDEIDEQYKDIVTNDIPQLQGQMESTMLKIKEINININEFPKLEGEDSDHFRFQRAINFILQNGGGKLVCPVGNYTFLDSVYIGQQSNNVNKPIPLVIEGTVNAFESHYGKGVNFISNTSKPILVINLKADGSCSMNDYTMAWTGFSLKNINFIGSLSYNSVAIKVFRCRLKMENITCSDLWKLIEQPQKDSKNQQTYSDLWVLKNIRFRTLRNTGIELWYADSSSIENIYCEKPIDGVQYIIDANSCESLKIYSLLSSMNTSDITNDTANTYIIRLISCSATIENMYVERIRKFEGAISCSNSNLIINNFSERYDGNTTLKIWNSNVIINGLKTWGNKLTGYSDILVIGGTSSPSKIKYNSTTLLDYTEGVGEANSNKRNAVISYSESSIKSFCDDITDIRVKYNPTTQIFDVTDLLGNTITQYGTPSIDNNDGIIFPSTVNGFPNQIRIKNKKLQPIVTGDFQVVPFISLISASGFFKISLFNPVDGVKYRGTALTNILSKIDFIITF